jgi:hypothetical protein
MTELNEKIGDFVGKLLVRVVAKEIMVPQAVQEIDAFMSSIQGRLPADEWAKMKAGLLSDLFSLERNMLRDGDDAQDMPAHTEASEPRGHVSEVNPVWQAIKAQLPEAMVNTPEREKSTAWNIGFLLGLGAESTVARFLRWLWKLP